MRKILSVLTALCLTLTLLPWEVRAAEMASGNCGGEGDGSNLTWTLDDAGTLTISGSGEMFQGVRGSFGGCWDSHDDEVKTIVIGEGATTIGDWAFAGFDNLTSVTIPDSVTRIMQYAFAKCPSLTRIDIPNGVTFIGESAFADCTDLTSVTISSSATAYGDNAFDGCTSLNNVTLPDGLSSLGVGMFAGCTSLTNIIIPDSVTSIEAGAFSGSGLTRVTIPRGVTSIEGGVFAGCGNLTSIALPDGVASIERYTFEDCANLTSVTIPSSVTSIGESAFAGCDNLTEVYYWGTTGQWAEVSVGSNNAALTGGHDIYYSGVPEVTISPNSIAEGAVDPVLTITSYRPFAPLSARVTLGYVEVDPGTTGLTPVSASLDAANNKIMRIAFSGTSLGGNVSITIPSEGFAGPDNFTAATVFNVTVGAPPAPAPDPTPDPVPAPSPSRDDDDDEPETTRPKAPVKRESVDVDDAVRTKEQEKIVISGQGESDMQGILKKGEFPRWIDRVKLPRYAMDLYTVLCIGGDGDRLYDLLIEDKYFTFSGGGSGGGDADVESVLELTGKLDSPYASGGGVFRESSFVGGFDVIDATAGDRAVSYEELKEGDVVRTASYNGIYVTKVRKDGNQDYDADLKTACAYASTVFQAFDRDHPEIFWLSGSTKLRLVTVTMKEDQRTYKETYIFFLIADADGFTVRDPQYAGQEVIEAAILRRDAAVDAILATVPGGTVYDQVAQLNRWLTEHNHYNTSKDLHNLPNAPHECLSALEGNIGADGPVCDGYSRAFKVLCEKLDIPCLLVDGYAKVSSASSGEFHMWNSVKMPDGQWYGVDVTWNDPTVKGVEDAKSGREREDYLLVGADTVVFGLKFSESHPPKNRAANGGVAFINGPALSAAAFHPLAGASALPFTDVEEGDWCYDAVSYVFDKGLMKGVSDREFSPDRPVTRAMVWTILARLAGKETGEGEPWYARAQSWAAEEGISDGTAPEALVTRQQLAAMLWRFAGSPASGGSLEGFGDSGSVGGYAADALRWAVESGVVSGGSDGGLRPTGSASRAHLAAMVQRFCQRQSA